MLQVAKLLRIIERRAVTIRLQRGGSGSAARREENLEPKRIRPNFSFRRVSEVMEGVRLQGMRAAGSKSSLQVSYLHFNHPFPKYTTYLCYKNLLVFTRLSKNVNTPLGVE